MSAEFAKNLLIEASAGTGKTQALAERLIELLERGVKPQEIVALTFSRAAAGEIFERFVTLLAERAERDAKAASHLREVVATQHLSQIGTLDSFLMRIVRAFPLELGLTGSIEMIDGFRASSERARVGFAILRRTDELSKRAFVEAFSLAMNREDVRSYVESYRKFLDSWHDRLTAMPRAESWGDPQTIWGCEPAFASVGAPELAAAADALETVEDSPEFHEFADWVRGFRGVFTGVKGIAKKLVEADDLFAGATVEFDFGRGKNRHRAYGGDAAGKIRAALGCVYGYVIRQKLELARGIHRLVSAYEELYDRRVRRLGRLVFADVPRLIAELDPAARLALEYRLDARIRAWALDEFQDTSREQWQAIGNLVDEARQREDKSVFVVGDRKQAIYGWRNGDVTIFEREKDGGQYALGRLVKTYRSGPAVIEAVNRVFAGGRMATEFPAWTSPVHETAKPDLDGFVQAFDAPGGRMEDFVDPVANALKAVDPVRRGIAAAVLVRGNQFGELLANGLKERGVEGVVWEGESRILDTPALAPFLDLVQLADHPGDQLAWRHFQMTPLASAKYPDGVPEAAEISREMARMLTVQGLVRTFRHLRGCLPDDPAQAWSQFTEERFTDMLRAAGEFELAAEPGTRLSDFAAFLAAKKKRNLAEPGKIKIMTIHRSKGLGFDYVVLPLYEHRGLTAEPDGPLVGEGWILPDPGAKVARAVGGLDSARQLRKDRAEQEALCAYYVAMTRAKRAMTIVCHPPAKTDKAALRFSDLVRAAIGGDDIGNRAWYRSFTPAAAESEPPVAPPPFVRAVRKRVLRRLPSLSFVPGQSAGELFAAHCFRQDAAARGVEAHARYERIEWIDPVAPKDGLEAKIIGSAWRPAFERPPGAVALWRERPFELFRDGRWTSGQLDRVVFSGTGDGRRAVVYDFKTNRRLRGESDAAFAARMGEHYAGQLSAYRAAVSSLTGIPPERVTSQLLLAETMAAVPVGRPGSWVAAMYY